MTRPSQSTDLLVVDQSTVDVNLRCPLPSLTKEANPIRPSPGLYALLENAGCRLASPVQDRLRFEAFLAELSATFVNVPADRVDSQIVAGLKQIVEFLGIDRSGLGELLDGQLVITHSYELPGVPPSPRVILEKHFPGYAQLIREGEAFRLPDDLPPETMVEWDYAIKTGLKSNLTIPLKVTGAVVGGIGFGSFRAAIEWPDDLVRRLRLVGDIFTNALARKRADEALKQAIQQARLFRDQLAHATRQELISHMTTSIAHEVNQPLCGISSNAQTALELLRRGDIEEARSALEDIWSDARRASEVIGRVRSMVKKEEPCRIPVRLSSIIEELMPLLTREATAKGVTLRIDLDAKDAVVVCDRVQLQQVWLNLVLNAVEAVSETNHGSQEVMIRTRQEYGEWVCICIEDTGIGLTEEQCEQVFAPFYTTKAKGLGMGLSISRSLIEAHGGNLWAMRGAERGTIFCARLPVASGGSHE
jgi:signal transduction histidine kinase